MKRIALAAAAAAAILTLGSPADASIQFDPLTGRQLHAPSRFVEQEIPQIRREVVDYYGPYAPGTIVVDTNERRLYYVIGDGVAMRYGTGVARPGFEWRGTHKVSQKREWPDWTPPPEMLTKVAMSLSRVCSSMNCFSGTAARCSASVVSMVPAM